MSEDLISLIKYYYETYQTNPIYIPLATFKEKGIDKNNTTLSIRNLEQEGVIEESYDVLGRYSRQQKSSELERGKFAKQAWYLKRVISEPTEEECKWSFEKLLDYIPNEQELETEISEGFLPSEEGRNLFGTFVELKINTEKLYQQNEKKEGKVEIYITKKGMRWIISKEKGGKLSFRIDSNIQQKIIDYLTIQVNKGFISAKVIADKTKPKKVLSKKPEDTIRTEISKINTSFKNKIRVKNDFIINGDPEGYRFNNLEFEVIY